LSTVRQEAYFYLYLIFTWTAYINSSHRGIATVQFITIILIPYLCFSFTIRTACQGGKNFNSDHIVYLYFVRFLELPQTIFIKSIKSASLGKAQCQTGINTLSLVECHWCWNTRVGTLIVATINLHLIQSRYMFRSFTLLQCSHQHYVQPVASVVEVVGYL